MADITGSVVISDEFGVQGMERRVLGKFDFAAALVDTDTYTIANLFPNDLTYKVKSFKLWGTVMDTNESPTLAVSVGNSDDADGYLAATVMDGIQDNAVIGGTGDFIGADEGVQNTDLTMTVTADPATGATSGTWYFEIVAEPKRI
jgi:hypothetical protein